MHLNFRTFKAVNDPAGCDEFRIGHRNILQDYGISNITTNNADWMKKENVHCIIAELLPEKKLVGGIRIEISEPGYLLPVEHAIAKHDKKIHKLINSAAKDGGVGELCALWNSKNVAGFGISQLLIRASVSLSTALKIKHLVCICADHTIDMFLNMGFVANSELGDRGKFNYPNQMYTARVLQLHDTKEIKDATEYNKERIKSLRVHPQQSFIEKGTVSLIKCDYNLVITEYK